MPESTTYRNALPLQSLVQEYRLESVLGVGGFGITYLGWDTHLEKHVAIKEYLPIELALRTPEGTVMPATTDNEESYQWGLDRFILEARTLAKFSHSHIVRVNRYFEANGTGYMVMDYEKGESLSQMLKRTPQPDEATLKNILMPLLDGLQAVHASGFLHRDIKPANIFIRESGSPVLLDFGAARQAVGGATKSLTAVLTPGYAPLEQYASDGPQGPWSDIYAMSGVLYRALTNDNPPDAVTRIRADAVPQGLNSARARYSGPFVKAIEWALAVDENQRPQNITEWRRALQGERLAPSVRPTVINPTVVNSAAAGAATVAATRTDATRAATAARTQSAPPPRRRAEATPLEPGPDGRKWRVFVIVACVVLALAAVGAWKKRSDERQAAVEKLQVEKRAAELRAAQDEASRAAAERRAAEQREVELRSGGATAAREDAERRPEAPRLPSVEAERRALDQRPVGLPDMDLVRVKMEQQFHSADGNRDGLLTRDEVAGRFPEIAKEFERVDLDGDGRISLDEFWRFRLSQMAGGAPPR